MNSYRSEIHKALKELLESDNKIILIGQSICDPYGGVCKITRGLSKYSDRIYNTPISEAAMIGLGLGMALQGYKPIVEIMFMDFMTLCMDQIFNIGLKIVDNHEIPMSLVIRTMMNNDESYGWTHSQDLSWLIEEIPTQKLHIDNIYDYYNIKRIYESAINRIGISIIIEDKQLYNKEYICEK